MAQRAAGTYAKKIFGDDKIKSVLKRLDRLTQDEVRNAVVQTLNVVHSLEEGMQSFVDRLPGCWCVAKRASF